MHKNLSVKKKGRKTPYPYFSKIFIFQCNFAISSIVTGIHEAIVHDVFNIS